MLLQREGIGATSIVRLGLLYCKKNVSLGQDGNKLNLVDLAKLPLTPILGNGLAPLQPLDRADAAERIAFLATCDPSERPLDLQPRINTSYAGATRNPDASIEEMMKERVRVYDAVGPETLTLKEILHLMAEFYGRKLRPVHVDYFNMERILNVASLGNYNRQFVSILRSEQDLELHDSIATTVTGNPIAFQKLFHEDAELCKVEDAFSRNKGGRRIFPIVSTAKWVWNNPGVIRPGIALGFEISRNWLLPFYQRPFLEEERLVKEGRKSEPESK